MLQLIITTNPNFGSSFSLSAIYFQDLLDQTLYLNVWCSTCRSAETDAVDNVSSLLSASWPSFLGCEWCASRLWQFHDRVVSSMRQPFVLKLILVPQMLCHLSKTSAALVIRLSFLQGQHGDTHTYYSSYLLIAVVTYLTSILLSAPKTV